MNGGCIITHMPHHHRDACPTPTMLKGRHFLRFLTSFNMTSQTALLPNRGEVVKRTRVSVGSKPNERFSVKKNTSKSFPHFSIWNFSSRSSRPQDLCTPHKCVYHPNCHYHHTHGTNEGFSVEKKHFKKFATFFHFDNPVLNQDNHPCLRLPLW